MRQRGFHAVGTAVLAVAAMSGEAHAQDLRRFNIEAQPAETGIPQFAHQARVDVLAPQGIVANRRVNSVRGQMTVKAALQQLLEGTNLTPFTTEHGAIVLRAAAVRSSAGTQVPHVRTVALADRAPSTMRGPASQLSDASPTPAEAEAQASPIRDAEKAAQDIVVTGSRVVRNGNNAPTPVTVISTDDLLRSTPTTVADALQQMPVFSSPRNQFGNPASGSGGVTGGNGGGSLLNLRNLGPARTLILFDGQRVPSTTTNGSVDVDMIPQLLLQRVDIVTGGVSAVYGSDAVAGVVNFITDRTFKGFKVLAESGISNYGDDPQYDLGIAYGANLFGGRGHFEASYEYRNDAGIGRRSDRPWLTQQTIEGVGTAAAPYQLFNNVRIAASPFGGKITSGVLNNQYFATNGLLVPFVNGAATPSACCQVGGAGGYGDTSLKAALKSQQAFARFDYDVSDHVHWYVDGSYTTKTNVQYMSSPSINNTFSATNAFLAPAYQAALLAAGQTTFTFGKNFNQAPRQRIQNDISQFWINTGLVGKLGSFDWSAKYSYGRATLEQHLSNIVNNQNFLASLDAVVNPATGKIVCQASLTNANYANCVPLNPFGPTSADPAAIGYIFTTANYKATNQQHDFAADISGRLFDNWAGPVTAALSGEYRYTSFESTTDSLPQAANCTSLRYNCLASTTVKTSYTPRSLVWTDVKEGAVEVEFPLLKDLPLVRALSVNGAARYTSYHTSGNYWTWKLSLDWHVTDALRFRAARSRDIRAPTLDDLYSPATVGTTNMPDYLTNTSPGTTPGTVAATTYTAGNPNLKSEIGQTWTAGVVWRPFSGFSLSVDGYWIRVKNGILSVNAYTPEYQVACYNSGGTSPYCGLQTRPIDYANTTLANVVTAWYNTVINVAEIRTHGVDFEANYAVSLFDRPLNLRVLTTWQPEILYITPGLRDINYAGSAFGGTGLYGTAKWRVAAFARYQVTPNFAVDVFERWRSALKHSTDTTQVWIDNHVAPFATTNLNLTFTPSQTQAQFFVNIQNLFNAAPPPTAFYAASTSVGLSGGFAIGDDPSGRNFTAGVRLKF